MGFREFKNAIPFIIFSTGGEIAMHKVGRIDMPGPDRTVGIPPGKQRGDPIHVLHRWDSAGPFPATDGWNSSIPIPRIYVPWSAVPVLETKVSRTRDDADPNVD